MPIYEYKCNSCSKTFSLMQKMGACTDGLACPECKGTELTKLLSSTFSPDSSKGLPSSFESAAASLPKMGGSCGGGMCGSGMCGM